MKLNDAEKGEDYFLMWTKVALYGNGCLFDIRQVLQQNG
jgi:hypothetical protein